jgi:hypothetical protein
MQVRGGQLTVLLDGDASAGFASEMKGFSEAPIIIATTSVSQRAHWFRQPYVSFSNHFYTQVAQGKTTRDAYLDALRSTRRAPLTQSPYLDANGDGVSDGKRDANVLRASGHVIGNGLLLAGDEPLIGGVASERTLTETGSASLWAENITTTSDLTSVVAYIAYPARGDSATQVVELPLLDDGDGRYSGAFSDFVFEGEYLIQYVAINTEGYSSLLDDSVMSTVTQSRTQSDRFEQDDTADEASVIEVNAVQSQHHTLDVATDEDWVVFYSSGTADNQ